MEGSAEISRHRNNLRNRKVQLAEFSKTLDELRKDTFANHDVLMPDVGLMDEEVPDDDASTTTAAPSDQHTTRRGKAGNRVDDEA